jgi:hypothetical protein
MRRLLAILMAALFSAVTVSAYAIDQGTQGNPPAPKQTKQKKKKQQGVSQKANPMDKSGQGTAQSSGTGGVKAGGESVNQPGRADPKATQGAGGVTSPTPTGAGRANNQ